MVTILVVDDAAFMRMRCAKLLQESGYTVIEAENGNLALEVYKAQKPDAALMDITMPEMDGLTALKALKEIDPNVRVAMVTAMGQQSIIMDAIKSGARDFVVKPFNKERVIAAVEKLLA